MKISKKNICALLLLVSTFNIFQWFTLWTFADDDEYEDRYERQEKEEDDDWKKAWYKTQYYEEEDWDKIIQEIVQTPEPETTKNIQAQIPSQTNTQAPSTTARISSPVKKQDIPQYTVVSLPQKETNIQNRETDIIPTALFIGANGKEFTIIRDRSKDPFSFIENGKQSWEYFSHKAEVIAYLNSLNSPQEKTSFDSKYIETNSLSPDYAKAVAEAEAQIKTIEIKTWKKAFILERPLVPVRLNALLKKQQVLAQSQKNTTIEKPKAKKTVPQKKIVATQPKVINTPKTPTKTVTQKPISSPEPSPTPVTKPVVTPTQSPVVVTPQPEPTPVLPPPSTRTRAS